MRTASRVGAGWTPVERAIVISVLAVLMGSLFVTSYSIALGEPVPHRLAAALVGNPAEHTGTVHAVQSVADDSLDFHRYGSVPAALHAMGEQTVYATLDLTSPRPTLYIASAAGASVARVLEGSRASIRRYASSTPTRSGRMTRTASRSSTSC